MRYLVRIQFNSTKEIPIDILNELGIELIRSTDSFIRSKRLDTNLGGSIDIGSIDIMGGEDVW